MFFAGYIRFHIAENKRDEVRIIKKIPEQWLNDLCQDIQKEIERWKNMNANGCNDPFWEDGINMNLIRNHIIYYRYNILQICTDNNLPLPAQYYLPLPPEVDANYMANLEQKERVERIRQRGDKITTKKPSYDDVQLSFL